MQTPAQTLIQNTAQTPPIHDFTASNPLANTTAPLTSTSAVGINAALDAFGPAAEPTPALAVDSGNLSFALDTFAPAVQPEIPAESIAEEAGVEVAESVGAVGAVESVEVVEVTDNTEPTDDSSSDEEVETQASAAVVVDTADTTGIADSTDIVDSKDATDITDSADSVVADSEVADPPAVADFPPDVGDPWTLEWYEPGMVLPRDRGPRTDIQPMRALPGTSPGSDGWYFDAEGRPSHWTHDEECGWLRTDD
jgi:hypothetical protein